MGHVRQTELGFYPTAAVMKTNSGVEGASLRATPGNVYPTTGVIFGGPGTDDTQLYRISAREIRSDTISVNRANSTDYAFRATKDSGDSDYRWRVRVDGLMEWGPGNTAPDTAISRSSAGVLAVPGLQMSGSLQHNGAGLGLFGVSNIVQQTVTGSRGGNAALASLLTKLAAYGLIIDSSTA